MRVRIKKKNKILLFFLMILFHFIIKIKIRNKITVFNRNYFLFYTDTKSVGDRNFDFYSVEPKTDNDNDYIMYGKLRDNFFIRAIGNKLEVKDYDYGFEFYLVIKDAKLKKMLADEKIKLKYDIMFDFVSASDLRVTLAVYGRNKDKNKLLKMKCKGFFENA